jgi:hypothetical protein
MVQKSCRLLSLPIPTEVVTSPDTQVQLLYALAQEEGEEMADCHDWQVLTEQHTFNTVAAEVQPGAVPSDWDHFINNSFFNRTTRREMLGPITPQMWQAIKAQPQFNQVFLCFRERDGNFLITPEPAAGNEIAYEYISKNFVVAANGDRKAEFTADTDTTVLPEKLIVLGIRWRFLKSKGLDYNEDFRTYQEQLQESTSREQGATKLDVTGRTFGNFWGYPNVPLGNWPG